MMYELRSIFSKTVLCLVNDIDSLFDKAAILFPCQQNALKKGCIRFNASRLAMQLKKTLTTLYAYDGHITLTISEYSHLITDRCKHSFIRSHHAASRSGPRSTCVVEPLHHLQT